MGDSEATLSYRFSVSWPAKPATESAAEQVRRRLHAAQAHLSSNRRHEALTEAKAALELAPENLEALALAGGAALYLDRAEEAERLFARAETIAARGSPEWAHMVSLRCLALVQVHRWAEAAHAAMGLVASGGSRAPTTEFWLGKALVQMNCADRGGAHLMAAAHAEPNRPDFRAALGDALRNVGELEGAEHEYGAAIQIDPLQAAAHYALAHLKRWSETDNHVARLQALLGESRLAEPDRALFHHALFKELDDLGRTDLAWPHLEAAKEITAAAGPRWSAEAEAAQFAALSAAFSDAEPPATLTTPGRRRPIFVTGLPRSGTTLVERILGAHSAVRPMGETPAFARLFREATPHWRFGADDMDWPALAQAYLDETAFFARGAQVSVDKMPENANYLGALARAFPDAGLVFVRRDPIDVLFGAYRLCLTYPWSHRLTDIVAHFANHERLIAVWRKALGPRLLIVEYERLVADPDGEIRALLRGVGLPFEAACLKPHETRGSVASSSAAQVRRPISSDRVGGWRRYADQLKPLLAAIGAH